MSINNYEQTNRSCINNSSAKQLYSFPKQKRFQYQKQGLTSRINFLGSNINESYKSSSFNKSKRQLVFENEQQYKSHPSPDAYNSSPPQNNKGIIIASKLKPFYYQKWNNPSPNLYTARSLDRISTTVFSKQVRQLKYPQFNRKGLNVPGPYLIETQKLKSVLSNFKNQRQTKFHKKVDNIQLNNIKLKIKAHQQKLRMKIEQRQPKIKTQRLETLNSSIIYKKQKTTIFDKQIRKTYFDIANTNPGPADRNNNFSEFGLRRKPDSLPKNLRLSKLEKCKSGRELATRLRTMPVSLIKTGR